MKFIRITAFIIAILFTFSLCSCSVPEQCNYDNFRESISDVQSVTACIYTESTDDTINDEKFDVSVTDEFLSLLDGEFQPADNYSIGNKVLSITVSMQYELCLFDNGYVMIYYGFTGVFQSDREYYKYKLNADKNELLDYIRNNGIIKNMEEESK